MTTNRLARAQMLRAVKEQAERSSRLETAAEIRRLATELPPTAHGTRKLFLDAAMSLERRRP